MVPRSRPCPPPWVWPTMGSPWNSRLARPRPGAVVFRPAPLIRLGAASAMSPDPSLVARLTQFGQGHLLRWWSELDEGERSRLLAEIEGIDLDQLDYLVSAHVTDETAAAPDAHRVGPIEVS